MNAITNNTTPTSAPEVSRIVQGKDLSIGTGFQAQTFRHGQFDGLMDPLIMVDHFTMTKPTFDAHAHAGMSAVTVLFEDSQGHFHNRDSLGNDIDLAPGDLYWLMAARGAIHDEYAQPDAKTHALQVFVNLPDTMRRIAAKALHVPAATMPILKGHLARARLMLGGSNGVKGASSPSSQPFTILDVSVSSGGRFSHAVTGGQNSWIYAVDGTVGVDLGGHTATLSRGEALAVKDAQTLTLHGATQSHAVILQGTPIREAFVHRGPFVMRTNEDIDAVEADYRAGRLGTLD
jgi:redox-sensitive bicupin YhaK (pirin superfamily)